jgi:ATP-dependent Clp protease adaptor protein ClpS
MSTQLSVTEDVTINFKTPNKYKVVLLNDDSTPMDFVVEILMSIFNKSISDAEAVTMEVHTKGKGIAGIYFFEIAEQKVFEATTISRNNGFPLSFKIEEE